MQRTIWKFTIAPSCPILMPVGAKMLHVHEQNDNICLWAEVDAAETATEFRTFWVYGAGHSLPDDPGVYIGTVHLHVSSLVFHVYEQSA